MGHVEIGNKLKDVLIETPGREEEQENKAILQMHEAPEKTENEKYYERILKNSLDQNTALRMKSFDMAEKGEWGVLALKESPVFRQKLPAARDAYKDRKAENAAKKEAKRTFADADLCTVREKASMEAYLAKMHNGDHGISGEDTANDPALSEYVDSILKMELNNSLFTDDYLSDHIADMYEYTIKLGQYETAREKYPQFFACLSDDTKALLETRVSAAADLKKILAQHMNLHGVRLEHDNKGIHVKLRRVEDERKNTGTLKSEYDRNLKNFLNKRIYEDEVNLARTYSGLDSFKSDNARREIDSRIAASTKAAQVCGEEMKAASDEMENAWKVRDKLLEDQKILLEQYDNEKNEIKKDEFKARIVRNNRRIRLASQHADHYRDFIDFVTGAVPMVKEGTAGFLEAENQTEMLDIVHIGCIGEFIEEALTGSRRMETGKKIASLKEDIEIKDSKVDGFELIERKAESEKEIRELEDALKKMDYVHMPLDTFYSKIAEFKKTKAESKRFSELRNMGKDRIKSAAAAAKGYAGRFLIQDNGDNDDRYLPIFLEPVKMDKAKIMQSDLTSFEKFAVFTRFRDSEELPTDVREEIRNRGKEYLNEILSITPEKMLEYSCPDEPDIESPEFWHKRAMVIALFDFQTTLDCFKQWNIPLTDEQYAHIMGLSSMAQGMVVGYDSFDRKMEDPIRVVADDERLKGDTLQKLCDNIIDAYRNGDGNIPDDEEVHNRLKRFGIDHSGLNLNVSMDNRRRDTSVLEAASYYIYEKNMLNKPDLNADNLEAYDKAKNQQLNGKCKQVFNEEKKLMQEFFPEAGDQEVRTRLLKRDMDALRKTVMTREQEIAWIARFGNKSDGAGDIRSFVSLLRPVRYDVQGVPTEESRKDIVRNNQDVEDYISGNIKRRNRVLRRIGKEIAAINITEDMLTYDYLKNNHTTLFPVIEKIHGFQNIWKEYPDFFESDAFTEEERDRIRQNITGSNVLSSFTSVYGQYCNSFMGEEKERKKQNLTKEEKINWGIGCKANCEMLSRTILELDEPEGVAGALKIQKKRVALYADKEKTDKIRRATVLWAKTKAAVEKANRDSVIATAKIKNIPEGARKAQKIEKLNQEAAGFLEQREKLQAKLTLVDEIVSFVYEEKDKLSDEAQAIFDNEMNESVIHVEYEEPYEEKEEGDEREQEVIKEHKDIKEQENIKEQDLKEQKDLRDQEQPIKQEKQQEDNIQQPVSKGPEYHAGASLAQGTVYEAQGYLNCWACSGAALFNKFIELSDGQLTGKVNQYDIRGFKPEKGELKTLEEVNALSGINLDQEWYDSNIAELNKFMGKDAKDNGSIFEAADFFMKRRKDFVLNQMEFRLNGGMETKDIEAYEAQKSLFMKQINDVLETGNLVAMYKSEGQHYVTITGIDGDNITYMDSLVPKGQPARKVTEPVEVLFSRNGSGNNMSITWFSKLKSPEEMKQDYPDLQYDEHEGYSYSRKEELQAGAMNLAQTRGICITKSKDDPVLGNDAVKHHIYIPKLGDEPEQQVQQQMHQLGGFEQIQHEEEEKRKRTEKGVILGKALYIEANKSAVKNGKFSKEFFAESEKFMKNVDAWAEAGDDQEKALMSKLGIRDTVDMLYVSGIPLRKFVAGRYSYSGDDVRILRAYAAMIAGRQKYPIVLARPVLNDKNEVDVKIEALNIDSKQLGTKKSKTGSKEYKKAQEDAKKKVEKAKPWGSKGSQGPG